MEQEIIEQCIGAILGSIKWLDRHKPGRENLMAGKALE